MDIGYYIGCYLKIETENDGFYEGYLQAIDQKHQKMSLQKVKHCSTGEFYKAHQFFSNQLIDVKIMKDVPKLKSSDADITSEIRPKLHAMKMKADVKEYKDASDAGPALFHHNQHIDPEIFLSGYDGNAAFDVTFNNDLNKPPSAIFINSVAKDFEDAISMIESQRVISIAVEGHNISRFGHISLVAIGTRQMVYLFDIEIAQNEFFVGGLKEILEDNNILKVAHDVRMISDCLYRVYQVKPRNIFDTQVADAFIYRQQHDELPSEVASLTDCVTSYLNIHPKSCLFEATKKSFIKNNSNIWHDRPFDSDFLKACAKTVMYLRELRTVMMEKLLAEYLFGVDIYLDCMRDKPDNVVKYEANASRYPKEFGKLPKMKQQRKQRLRHKPRFNVTVETDSQEDSSTDDSTSHRSAWDVGSEFADRYKERHGEIIECIDSKAPPLLNSSKPLLKNPKLTDNNLIDQDKVKIQEKHDKKPKKGKPKYEKFKDKSITKHKNNKGTPHKNGIDNSDKSSPSDKYLDKSFTQNDEVANQSNHSKEVFDLTGISDIYELDEISPIKTISYNGNALNDYNFDNNTNFFTGFDSSPSNFASLFNQSQESIPSDQEFPSLALTKVYNESLISTTSDSDDGIYTNSVNSKQRGKSPAHFPSPFVNSVDMVNKHAPTNSMSNYQQRMNRPVLGNAAKKIIQQNIRPFTDNKNHSPTANRKVKTPDSTHRKSKSPSNKSPTENRKVKTAETFGRSSKSPNSSFNNNFEPSPILKASPVKTFGRGHLLKMHSENLKRPGGDQNTKIPISPPALSIGRSCGYDFPSDNELLETPQVVPMIDGKHIAGEQVSVLKKY